MDFFILFEGEGVNYMKLKIGDIILRSEDYIIMEVKIVRYTLIKIGNIIWGVKIGGYHFEEGL